MAEEQNAEVTVAAEAEVEAEAEALPPASRLAPRVLFGCVVLLDAVLIYLQHSAPFDIWSNVNAIRAGATPADIFYAVALAQALSLFLFCRLVLERVPTAAARPRFLTAALALPAWLLGNAGFELAFFHYLGHYADPAGQMTRILLLIAGAAGALTGLALFVTAGLSEGAGGSRRSASRLFLRLWPLALLVGMPVLLLRHLSQAALVLPVAGPILRAAVNLWLPLALVRALARMVRPARPVAEPEPPGLPLALPAVLSTLFILLLFLLLPPPPFHFDARPTPPLVPTENKVSASGFDDRDRKVTYSSQRMMVVVGQDPFEFGVIDNDRRILLKLLTDPDRAARYRGVASNLELRGLASLPLGGAGQLLRSRFELWSDPILAANSIRLSAGELIAESRLGRRPLLVTFSFVDDDVLKITVDAGARMAFHSTSVTLACGEHEKFFGLGSLGGADLRGRDLDLLTEPGRGDPAGGGWLRRLTGGRAAVAAGARDAFWPAPFLYMSRGVGLYLAETVDPRFEVASRYPDAVRLSGRGGALVIYVIRGDHPEDIVARARLLTGSRAVPPAPALLPWVTLTEPGSACGAAAFERLQPQDLAAGYVLVGRAAMGGAEGQCPGLKDFLAAGRKQGLRFVFEDTGRIAAEGPVYEEAARRGYLVMNRVGLPLRLLTTRGPQSVIDFTHPAVLKWRLAIWKRMRDLGFTGLVLDPLALVPPEAELYNGESGATMRNTFPLIYAESAARAWGKGGVLAAEAGYAGMERYVSVLRRGPDEPDDYPLLLSLGVSGAPSALSRLSANDGFLPLMELPPAGAASGPAAERRRRAVETHLRLFPYIYSLLAQEAATGAPALFPPALTAPQEDFGPDSYFLGRRLLVAVPPAGAQTMPVRFPRGGWRQLDTLKFYAAGPREIKVTGPTAFLLESSILATLVQPPRRPADLSAAAPLNLLLHPGSEAIFKFYDGTEFVSRSFPNSLLLETTGEVKRNYAWEVLDVPEPTAIFMDSIRQPRKFWEYQPRARMLTLPRVPGPHRVEVVTPDELVIDPLLLPPAPRIP